MILFLRESKICKQLKRYGGKGVLRGSLEFKYTLLILPKELLDFHYTNNPL